MMYITDKDGLVYKFDRSDASLLTDSNGIQTYLTGNRRFVVVDDYGALAKFISRMDAVKEIISVGDDKRTDAAKELLDSLLEA